jgi:hypothetical protein
MILPRQQWLERARQLLPTLARSHIDPAHWDRTRPLGRYDRLELDFGRHLVGYFRFRLRPTGTVDAPTRLRLTFAERRSDLELPPEPYTAQLSRAWIQDEVITLDDPSAEVVLPRRYAFRHVRVEIIDTSQAYGVCLESAGAESVTSAIGEAPPLPPGTPADLARLDRVSLNTLRSCMQTVFEDGPKRDRRLWTGDLRLQALTNAVTFRQFDLVRRCLYLLAAHAGQNGASRSDRPAGKAAAHSDELWFPADVYERPTPGGCLILDYSVLLAPILLDHFRSSGDRDTALDLFPLAAEQFRLASQFLREGLLVVPEGWWLFSDWRPGLDQQAPTHATILYALRQFIALAGELGLDPGPAESTAAAMTAAARTHLYDKGRGLFVSGSKRQVSWASAAWMVLAGVVTGAEARTVLRHTFAEVQAVLPAGPYLYHHVVQAMLDCGMDREAGELLRRYWGSMLTPPDADTFDEIHDPANPDFSPYGHPSLNSRCHAWSCTPAYFIRTYGARLY